MDIAAAADRHYDALIDAQTRAEQVISRHVREAIENAIAAMFSATTAAPAAHPMAGKYVICRCYSAGVHAGVLVSQTGDQAVLKDSRRLWSWKAKSGVALSGLSQHGLGDGKVDTLLPEIALTGVIETIPCSQVARESIHDY